MTEITITGANAITYPALNIWDWRISLYLFLVAAASGLLVMSSVAFLRRRKIDPNLREDIFRAAVLIPILLITGMFMVWLELESKQNIYWIFLSFSFTSSMFWGTWALTLALPAGTLFALSLVPDGSKERLKFNSLKALSRGLASRTGSLAGLCCALGIFLGLYTGVSLATFEARPLWNSEAAPFLFLVSALSIGAAFGTLTSRKEPVRLFFTKALIWLLGSEIVAVFLFFLRQLTSSPAKRSAVMPFFSLTQEYFLFELSFAVIGILLPLVLALKFLRRCESDAKKFTSQAPPWIKLSAWLVIAGSIILRLGWVYLGQLSKL